MQVTTVVPTGKVEPEGGVHWTLMQFAAVGAKVTTAPLRSAAVVVMSAGQVSVQPGPMTLHWHVTTVNDQLLSVPVSPPTSSSIVMVHVPLGFSPMNAANASSGASVVAAVPETYGWSFTSPAFVA